MPASKKDNDGSMSDKIAKKERKKWKVICNYNSGVAEGELERPPSKKDLDGLMSDKIAKKERKKRKVISNYDSDAAEEGEPEMPSSKKDNDDLMSDKIVKKERKKRKVTSNYNSGVAEEGELDRHPSKVDNDRLKSDKIARKERKKQKVTSNYNSGVAEEEEQDRPFAGNCEASTNVVSMSDKVAKKEEKKQIAIAKYKDGDEHVEQDGQIVGVIEADNDDGLTSNNVAKRGRKKQKAVRNYNGDGDGEQDGLLVCHTEANCTKQSKRKNKGGSEKYNDGESSNDAGNMDKKKKKSKSVDNGFNSVTPSKSSKKVSFSGHVDVFDIPSNSHVEKNNKNLDMVRGKRFTQEEKDTIKEAVYKYIADHDLGEKGLDMVLNSKKYSQLRGCWKEIGAALPHRPNTSVYWRAQILFRRSEHRKWTQEEYDTILKHHAWHGNEWKALADELGKDRWHVRGTWRRIKLRNAKKGHWSQKEYQDLFDLVNIDLRLRIAEEKRSKHGMLRDNICWTAISDKLSTRPQAACCLKWYCQLTSPMVAEGVWADTDDYRLVDQLY